MIDLKKLEDEGKTQKEIDYIIDENHKNYLKERNELIKNGIIKEVNKQ